ncbi:hypothetical protein PVW51_16975 [Sulfitobacter sp. PR48]|uniref:hypothetical protein n=1 Tax=unclassified Sulfitobacter TaxID=196795 RepID=UPI0022AF4DCB|nr:MULTISPECIES: hypothetical protein [unclassified Sulfitobacter]MCZ4257161.1 hypothetical protein [Sulfitobacter sp. G21635-S1]MDD9722400.1 hypothetical protein [Sulfitobacter sp. PR48]
MIGVLLIVVALAFGAFWVGGMVLGVRDTPPFGWSVRACASLCAGMALAGVILMGLNI